MSGRVDRSATGAGPHDDDSEGLLRAPGRPQGMEIERETLLEAGISIAAVGLFVFVMMGIGTTFGNSTGEDLHGTGALALIAAIVAFILVMAVVGLYLDRQDW